MLKKITAKFDKKSASIFAVVIGFIMFIAIAITTNLFSSGDLPVQISGALLEAVVTALITYFLLTGQTTQEEIKEKQVKVFEKKQEVYHNFLEELKRIIQDGDINICLEKNIDELKDLIFQLGYLRMHTNERNVSEISRNVSEIISTLEKQRETNTVNVAMPLYYEKIYEKLNNIVKILRDDLYGEQKSVLEDNNGIKESFNSILSALKLTDEKNTMQPTVEESSEQTNSIDFTKPSTAAEKHQIQKKFWFELEKQLRIHGYTPKLDSNYSDNLIALYYKSSRRNKHRWYGLEFEIYKTKSEQKPIMFRFEIEDAFYYGFKREGLDFENQLIDNCVRETSLEFNKTRWWHGFKYSKAYNLNFWYFNSPGFADFIKDEKRERYVSGLVDEIEIYIKKFLEIAKVNNL